MGVYSFFMIHISFALPWINVARFIFIWSTFGLLVLCPIVTLLINLTFLTSLNFERWGSSWNYTIRRHRCAISFSLHRPFSLFFSFIFFQPKWSSCGSCSASVNMPPPFLLQHEHIWSETVTQMRGQSGVSFLPLMAAEAYNVIYGAGAHFSNSIMNFDYWWKFETGKHFDRKLKPQEMRRILVGVHESSGSARAEEESAHKAGTSINPNIGW